LRTTSRELLSVFLLALPLAIAAPARADDFVVDTATTTTNGGNTVDGGDTLTVTEDGSIETTGVSVHGVSATGPDNAVTNHGTISTQGNSGIAIYNYDSDNSAISNSGVISTEGAASTAIYNFNSDNSAITNTGTITTEGAGAAAIRGVDSDNSTINNSGVISTEGDGATGIGSFGSDNSAISNSGSISTIAADTHAIQNEQTTNAVITNTGSLSTMGANAFAIFDFNSNNSAIINSGAISSEAPGGLGIVIYQSNYSTAINSGVISTEGLGAAGVTVLESTNAAATNMDTILTEGEGANGMSIVRSENSSVLNTGAIRTKAQYSGGIVSRSNVNSAVTNSGLVVSERSYAFYMQDVDGVLNLLAPSYIGGMFGFVEAPTVSITTGPSHSVLWTLDDNMIGGDPNISGAVPWFYDASTKQFATYDPSAFAGSLDALGDMTNMLSQVARAGLDGERLWITGFGGRTDHDGDAMTLGRDVQQLGVAIGLNGIAVAGFDWGVMAGYLNSQLDAASRWTQSYDIEGEGFFAGLNGKQTLGGFTVDLGVTGGRADYDQSRFVNDNLALTNGLTLGKSWATSSYAGWFVSPEIGVSTQLATLGSWTFTPAARLRYAGQWLDGFAESGSNSDATVGDRAIGMIEASGELQAAKTVGDATVSARVGYLSRISTGDEAASVTMLGISNTVGFGDTDAEALYAGAGLDLDLGSAATLKLDVTGFLSGDVTGAQAMGQIAVPF
jgi:autotransporter-like protein